MRKLLLLGASALALLVLTSGAAAGPDHGLAGPDDGIGSLGGNNLDPSAALIALDAEQGDVVSTGPFADVVKNLAVAGRGERLMPNATTDVWALDGYAYIGTFNEPCGDGTGANGSGVRIFDVSNPNRVRPAGFLPSVEGSRINDVKVANMGSGTILVHSNESCAGGAGGFEVYEVSNPLSPVHLAHVQVDDSNAVLRDVFGVTDVGVHNLFLFEQGARDYVALQAEGFYGSFQIYELTDPADPQFVSAWGAEHLCPFGPTFCSPDPNADTDAARIVSTVNNWLLQGFGASRNRLLHDMTISADGTKAYLSNWDAGLVLLDISDPANPQYVSTALDPTVRDGEVNSHAAWPTADGKTVVETEEDFEVFSSEVPLGNFTFQDRPTNTIPGVGVSTNAGDDFEANPGNNVTVNATSVTVNSGPLAGNVYPASEGVGNQPRFATTGPITGDAEFVGLACDPVATDLTGKVAIARRGTCFFGDKLANVAAAGATAIVIANNVGDSDWSGIRIWDYSDPENPQLASIFDTLCSVQPRDASCDRRGTYSVHNVIVEGSKAYLSWYSDGVLILDISDPYNPVEIARYHREGPDFEAMNGGIQNFWGIYKESNRPWIYASDRNGGLYVLKEYGSGSAKQGKR